MEQNLVVLIGDNSSQSNHPSANLKVPLPALANSHTRGRPYKCPHCTFSCHSECSLKSHMRIHTGEKPFQCDFCQLAFAHNATLTRHVKTHERIKEKSLKCKVNSSAITDIHTDNANNEAGIELEKPFKCHFCESWFTRISNLKVHERSHTGEKSLLEKHKKIRFGEKTYFRCSICSKIFAHNSSLYRHLKRNHTDDKHEDIHHDVAQSNQDIGDSDQIEIEKKPLQCYFCPSAFLTLDDLEKHMRIHTNGTHTNKQCDESQSNIHICNSDQTQIEKKPLQCQICPSAFFLLEDLQKHLQTHNGKNENGQSKETQSYREIFSSDLMKVDKKPVTSFPLNQ